MTDSLEFFDRDEKAGFRLHRAEVYNWGTFNEKIWTLHADGENTLLTGDIGSGKSTFVDAITTLLVPSQKIVYNKAAGAETRERNARSYVLGNFKSERGDTGLASRSVSLRDVKNYSVILGHFYNEGYQAHVSLAQVFWFRDPSAPPTRFFVVADKNLSILENFSGFGSDMSELRRRLRNQSGIEVFDSFTPYSDAFRRRFGIDNPQALDLFAQTVSMKAVGNLTDFVREHMLEPADAGARIERLISHFDDLNRAHEAILKAQDQIQRLEPLIADCARHTEIQCEVDRLRLDRDSLRPWFARLKVELLEKRLEDLAVESQRQRQKHLGLEETLLALRNQRDDLKRAIAENGGDRLDQLDREIATHELELGKRRDRFSKYGTNIQALGLLNVEESGAFSQNLAALEGMQESQKVQESELQNQRSEDEASFRQLRQAHEALASELESLRRRPTNIPREQIIFRENLCQALKIDADEIPFAGELLAVRPDDNEWEGAIERILRAFALSLLVPDRHYSQVSAWVEQTNLRGRLVYFRVREGQNISKAELSQNSMLQKLAVKSDSQFKAWIESHLAGRFDYVCCDNLDQFRRERQALTKAGQIKGGGERHEKDDRHLLNDRTRFVLGWSNQAKIQVLEIQVRSFESQLQSQGEKLSLLQTQIRNLQDRLQILAVVATLTDFTEIDWWSVSRSLAELVAQKKALQAASNQLAVLSEQLDTVQKTISLLEIELETLTREQGQNEAKVEAATALLCDSRAVALAPPQPPQTLDDQNQAFDRLLQSQNQALGTFRLTVESCENHEEAYRKYLHGRIDSDDSRLNRLQEKIVKAMQEYRTRYPLEVRDVDATLASAQAFRAMLVALSGDDLPRYEQQFKELLNENTIREVANFQSQLARDRQTIKERIDFINQSLTQIDYNPGRYIRLEADPSSDVEIREFVQELRTCTEGSLTGSGEDLYSEAKFLQVKKIIERFRARPAFEEVDRRWTAKVTDVRQAFVFSASERWKEDNREHEHYTDSAGKSGGQKEKLAYTVLAASLAYQFGLEWGAVHSRTFRFVVIDEAFGRGSDESTQYGLRLFARLNLQLLIVTPLQKISVIEPFVASVGFVSNDDGQDSRLRNLSISEYRREKAQHDRKSSL